METTSVLAVQQASKRFGTAAALLAADLHIERGEWVGLLGPNGAGKTTLVRAIAGRVRLDAGTIAVDGALGLVPQDIALYAALTARENLEVFGSLHRLRGSTLRERVAWALEWTGLAERAREPTGGFSGGMKRRLNLACGVLHRPALVLLDEPTIGVDPQSRERIFGMLEELQRAGTALLHTTHDLDEAESVCRRVVIIDRGRIVAAGTPTELVTRTLGCAQEIVVALDRAPAEAVLPPGASVDGQTVRMTVTSLGADLPALVGRLRDAGYGVVDVRVMRPDLSAVFLHLTGRELRE
ncbi:MAG: ABC transporter ATP-binding protein [Candidatus Binatia bacterium]